MDTPLGHIRSVLLDPLCSIAHFDDQLLCKATINEGAFRQYLEGPGSDDANLDLAIDQVIRSHGVPILLLAHEMVEAFLIRGSNGVSHGDHGRSCG